MANAIERVKTFLMIFSLRLRPNDHSFGDVRTNIIAIASFWLRRTQCIAHQAYNH